MLLLYASTFGPAYPVVLDRWALALRWMKHLTINYKILECRELSRAAVADISKLVREMYALQTLQIEFAGNRTLHCSEGLTCQHDLLILKALKDRNSLLGAGTGKSRHKIQAVTVIERSGQNEIRSTTMYEVSAGYLAYVLGHRARYSTYGVPMTRWL